MTLESGAGQDLFLSLVIAPASKGGPPQEFISEKKKNTFFRQEYERQPKKKDTCHLTLSEIHSRWWLAGHKEEPASRRVPVIWPSAMAGGCCFSNFIRVGIWILFYFGNRFNPLEQQ